MTTVTVTPFYFKRGVKSLPPHGAFKPSSLENQADVRAIETINILHDGNLHALIGLPEILSLAEQSVLIESLLGDALPGLTIIIENRRAFLKFSETFALERAILAVNPRVAEFGPSKVLSRLAIDPRMSLGAAMQLVTWLQSIQSEEEIFLSNLGI